MNVNFSGTWVANLASSKFMGPPPRALVVTISQSDDDLQEEMLVTKSDGGEDRLVFRCRINGEQETFPFNGQSVRTIARWEGLELAIESWMQLGPRTMHFCDYWSLSPDGETLTMEHRDDDLAGQRTVLKRPA